MTTVSSKKSLPICRPTSQRNSLNWWWSPPVHTYANVSIEARISPFMDSGRLLLLLFPMLVQEIKSRASHSSKSTFVTNPSGKEKKRETTFPNLLVSPYLFLPHKTLPPMILSPTNVPCAPYWQILSVLVITSVVNASTEDKQKSPVGSISTAPL